MFKSRKVLMAGGCFAILVVALMMGLTACGDRDETHQVINKQLEAIRGNNIKEAYSYTSEDFKKATTEKEFEEFVDHYPALKDNKSISFGKKSMQNDVTSLSAILYAKETKTPVEYLLVQEDKNWRVMGIQVNPSENQEEAVNAETTPPDNTLSKTYNNQDSRYSIKYPASWEYEKSGDGTIIFSGRRGSPAYFSTINIQTVLTKKSGGDFTTVKEFMNDIKKQAKTQSPGVKFSESGPIKLKNASGIKGDGEYTVFQYQFRGQDFKQWQVVILREDAQVFYAWAYTAPLTQYPDSIGIAKAMLDTWVIY